MILLENITKSYETGGNSMQVLKGIDLNIKSGELVSIMGSSGSGKST
ncbi:MAG: ATP-binding cassette domain-containing protein, partial [Flavobacteriales bacterium]